MKKLVFTTAIALALATTAYAADKGGRGGGPSMGGGGGPSMSGGGGPSPSMSASGPGPGSAGPSNFSAGRGPSNFSNTTGPRGPSGIYNKANGPNFDRDRDRFSDRDRLKDRDHDRFSDRDRDHNRFSDQNRDRNQHLFNSTDRNLNHGVNHDHHGVVSGNFFEHGRHFRFRRFFHGDWVFLTAWDDCTAWAWVHVAPGVWAWRPVNICIG